MSTTSPRPSTQHRSHGFTLIELLVVIAIIAVLVSILLPALARARLEALKTQSLSNLPSLNIAAASYGDDYNGFKPITATYRRYPPGWPPTTNNACTWTFGGKNNDRGWVAISGGIYDVEAADRPLNPYVYPEVDITAPPLPQTLGAFDERRTALELEAFRDPSDKLSYQKRWPSPNTDGLSSYDDVGTSYHSNLKWWFQLNGGAVERVRIGADQIRLAEVWDSARFVWLHDQYADLVVNANSPDFRLENGYGDINRSLLAFMDGHAAYKRVIPGNTEESYINSEYAFVFPDLPLP